MRVLSALVNELVPYKRGQWEVVCLVYQKKKNPPTPTTSAGAFIFGFPVYTTVTNIFMLFFKLSTPKYFVIVHQRVQDDLGHILQIKYFYG